MRITLLSFFSGIGLLDLGFEDEGFEIALVNDSHTPFINAYRSSRKGLPEPLFGYFPSDISDFMIGRRCSQLRKHIATARSQNDLVGFIGGPPCPDFSVAGKNKGRDGQNGILSQVYCDLIRQFRPDFFLFENVKGLWKTPRHRAFYEELKQAMRFAGYLTSEQLVNAIEYGTPQNRERILLFGVIDPVVRDLELATITSDDGSRLPSLQVEWRRYATHNRTVVTEHVWPTRSKFQADSVLLPPRGIPLDLTVQHWFTKNDVANHPNAEHYFKPKGAMARFMSIEEGDDSRKSFKRLHRWRYSPTAAYGHNEVHLHPYKVRRLSVAESLAIQSVPSGFSLPATMTLTDMFQGVGNGVPYLLARGVARTIMDLFSRESSVSSPAGSTANNARARKQ